MHSMVQNINLPFKGNLDIDKICALITRLKPLLKYDYRFFSSEQPVKASGGSAAIARFTGRAQHMAGCDIMVDCHFLTWLPIKNFEKNEFEMLQLFFNKYKINYKVLLDASNNSALGNKTALTLQLFYTDRQELEILLDKAVEAERDEFLQNIFSRSKNTYKCFGCSEEVKMLVGVVFPCGHEVYCPECTYLVKQSLDKGSRVLCAFCKWPIIQLDIPKYSALF